MMELDRETHIYTPNLRSVTEILRSVGLIDAICHLRLRRPLWTAVAERLFIFIQASRAS
jgi:hypothetical protein